MSKRPFRVTLSMWLVLFLTIWNGFRLWTAITWRDLLIEFSVKPDPLTSAIIGAIWLVTGCILLWGILFEKIWAKKFLIGAAAVYSVWYWTERLIWQEPRPNWPFAVIFNLVLFIHILFTTRAMSREAYERKNENPTLE